jgi:hypothetical protein
MNFPDQVPKDYKPKRKKLHSNNTVGYRGVTKNHNKFAACIQIGRKYTYLGSFSTKEKAAIAFDLAAIGAKRSISDLNFPDADYARKEEPKKKKTKLVKVKRTNTTGTKRVRKKGKHGRKFPSIPKYGVH